MTGADDPRDDVGLSEAEGQGPRTGDPAAQVSKPSLRNP